MGHKKSMVWQVRNALDKLSAYGQSKNAAKHANGGKPPVDRIYSIRTMDSYKAVGERFATWAYKEHGCTTLAQAEQYTGEWLGSRMAEGKSAFTIRTDAAALGKLYQKPTTSLGVTLPTRHRADVTQYRGGKEEGHFDKAAHSNLVEFCRDTGLRRHEVAALRPQDVTRLPDGRAQVHVIQGKGGKERYVTALSGRPADLAEAAAANGQSRVFSDIPKYAPIHSYRRDYANELYNRLARDVSTLPRSERYDCRGDRAGSSYDRAAMREVSAQLGHNRVSVIAQSYLSAK